MRYLDEYRDARLARALAAQIARRATRPWTLMEICGGQTHTLMRYGIDQARRGWLEKAHVLNTLPWRPFQQWLQR